MYDKPLPPPPLPVKPELNPPPIPRHRPQEQSASVAGAVKLFEKAAPHITANNAATAYKVASPHLTTKNAGTAFNMYNQASKSDRPTITHKSPPTCPTIVHRSPPALPEKPAKPNLPVQSNSAPHRTQLASTLKNRFEPGTECNSAPLHHHTDPAPSSISVRSIKSQLESKLTMHPPSAVVHPTSGVVHPTSGVVHPASGVVHPTSGVVHPPRAPVPPPKMLHSTSSNAICDTPVSMRPKPLNKTSSDSRKSLPPPARPPPPNRSSRNTSPTGDEPYATVLHEFNGQKEDELTVKTGDHIILKRDVDAEWVYGYCVRTGKYGIIPKTFVRIERPLESPRDAVSSPTNSCDDDSGIGNTIDDGPRCYTLYEFRSNEPGDLCFNSGEMIKLTGRPNAEWLFGETAEGRAGNFPSNFVQIIQDLPATPVPQSPPPPNLPQYNSPVNSAVVPALYDYSSAETGDLNFKAGDKIELISQVNSEWLRGRCRNCEGIFPANFVESVPNSLQMESGVHQPQTSAVQPEAHAQGNDFVGRVVVAQYEYASMDKRDLYLFVGDRIQVTAQPSPDWLEGRKIGDHGSSNRMPSGMFPSNFVAVE